MLTVSLRDLIYKRRSSLLLERSFFNDYERSLSFYNLTSSSLIFYERLALYYSLFLLYCYADWRSALCFYLLSFKASYVFLKLEYNSSNSAFNCCILMFVLVFKVSYSDCFWSIYLSRSLILDWKFLTLSK